MSGLDLAQEARKLDPGSRVILMTGYPSLVTAQQALQKGSLRGNEAFAAKVTLEIPGLGVKVPFEGEIKLQ